VTSDVTVTVLELIVSLCLFPTLALLIIGLIQYARCHDARLTLRSLVTWWVLLIVLGCCVLSVLFRMVARSPSAFLP
jgi:hypothetical protein